MRHRLKTLMLQHDVTCAELQRRSGISKGNVSKLVNAEASNPTLSTLMQLARAFNMSVSQLLSGV